jgi:uncharacterized alpha-E superfamily protein
MLSSTADHLYWMARRVERAENIARILDVTYRMSLLPQGISSPNQEWEAPLLITGLYRSFFEKHSESNAANVLDYMALDADNPSSIRACLRSARENGRAVRGAISSEMWETLNATWLKLSGVDADELRESGITSFFDRVKTRSHLFRGVTVGTMLQDEAYHFIRLGTFFERADNTARLLDVKYHVLLPSVRDVGGAADYYQWGAVLRSLSAFEAYRKIYRGGITPRRVAELLLLRDDVPRSMHACLKDVYQRLQVISGRSEGECQRLAGELHASLRFGRIEEIFRAGLHEFLTDFLRRMSDLGDEINREFLWPVPADDMREDGVETAGQRQWQRQG